MFPSFHSFVRGGNLFLRCEVEEKTLPYVMEIGGENSLMFASGFLHERQREEVDSDIDILLAPEDITDVQKNMIQCKPRFLRRAQSGSTSSPS